MVILWSIFYIYFQVRAWAVRCVRDLGLISPDDYDLLADVIGWMINVVQFNLFENIDALSPENTDAELPFDFLPPHLFVSLTRREYWLGLFVLVRQMDVSTVRTCFTNSTEHATFLRTLLSLMETEIRGNLIYFGLFTFIAILDCYHHLPTRKADISFFSKIQLVVYYQCWVLIGWATTRLYVIAH